MINPTVIAFIEKVNSDSALHSKVTGEPRLNVMVSIAAENGFQFTGEDWVNTVKALYSGELSEGDLANIAGGATGTPQPPVGNPLGVSQGAIGNLLPGANATGIPNFSIGHQGSH